MGTSCVNCWRNRPARQEPAFSLVELLVVVAILGVLASLLLPTLARAQRQARQTACLSNLKQIGLAFAGYQDDAQDRFPDERPRKAALGYRPWTDWPPSDPRAGWAAEPLRRHLPDLRVWSCPGLAQSPWRDAPQVRQWPQTNSTPTHATTAARYWLWRFDRIDDPIPADNFWNKTSEAALQDLRGAGNPQVGTPAGTSEVELAVDVYFPATIPTVSPELKGRAAHPQGRNQLRLDLSAVWIRDRRLR
jgi:prepilin-type N-terminal cleavage/methylation domain-containing protein